MLFFSSETISRPYFTARSATLVKEKIEVMTACQHQFFSCRFKFFFFTRAKDSAEKEGLFVVLVFVLLSFFCD